MKSIKFRRPYYKANGEFSHFAFFEITPDQNVHVNNLPKSLGQPREDELFVCDDKFGKSLYEGDYVEAVRHNSQLGGQGDVYEIYHSEKYNSFCYICVNSNNLVRIGKVVLTSSDRPYLISGQNVVFLSNKHEDNSFKNVQSIHSLKAHADEQR